MSKNTSTTQRLEGKVALVTGGASGIGETTARLFIKQGAKVIIADVQDDLGLSLCKQLGSEQTISYIHCDVTNDSDVKNAVDLAVSKYGKLDIMFSNAAISGNMTTSILETDNEDFKRVMEVNTFGGFLAAKHAARVMIPAKKGCIVFTASTAASICSGLPHPYTVSKHAIVGFTKNLCVELGQYGIRVNVISPFAVVTPMLKKSFGLMELEDGKIHDALVTHASNLKGAVCEADDIAEAALYLVSDESKYVSGMNLVVDGGFSISDHSLGIAMKSLFS